MVHTLCQYSHIVSKFTLCVRNHFNSLKLNDIVVKKPLETSNETRIYPSQFGNSTEYEDGKEDKAGSWEGGIDGAQPGVIMMKYPLAGFSYRQEYYQGKAEDMAEVIRLNQTVTIGLDEYEDVLIIREWNPLEPGVLEDKYYAPGIGVI